MILLVNPRVTKPKHSRFPLSLLHLGAALPPGERWEILDGNRAGADLLQETEQRIAASRAAGRSVELVAVTVMPGPQLASAVAYTREIKARYPDLPIVWGGYFPTLYPDPVLRAPEVDWVIRGQGERTLVELLAVLRGERDAEGVAGLSFTDGDAVHRGSERKWEGPGAFPPVPWSKIAVDDYLATTFLGRRTGVYQASIGCPYRCNFCGVIGAWGRREEFQSPERIEADLRPLVTGHGMDSVHFYDNNFFLQEEHAREVLGRLATLGVRWWCESRADVMLRYDDATWQEMRRAGLAMVFYGAESGSDASLERMNKDLRVEQVEGVARRCREHGIVPEFSFCLGDPEDPVADVNATFALIQRLKAIHPDCEIIFYYYTPTPQKESSYYDHLQIEVPTPVDLDEWCEPQWTQWSMHTNPQVPWLSGELRETVENFELVLRSRFPSVQELGLGPVSRGLLRAAAWRRWSRGDFSSAPGLRRLHRRLHATAPDPVEYGHLRKPAAAS